MRNVEKTKNKKVGWDFDGKIPNLLKNRVSGKYYGRFKVAGKQKWINLETTDRSVAGLKINDERKKVVENRLNGVSITAGTATMAFLIDAFLDKIGHHAGITPNTKAGYVGAVQAIRNTWPGIDGMNPRKITRSTVENWRDRIAVAGTGSHPPGVKHSARVFGNSPALINKCIDMLRRIINIAVETGQLSKSPIDGAGLKLPMTPKKVKLPDHDVMEKIFLELEERAKRGGHGGEAADFCRFIAYSGARLGEVTGKNQLTGEIVNPIRWCDVHFDRGLIHIRGTKTAAADRWVPIFPEMRALLDSMRAKRATIGAPAPDAKLFEIMTAAKSLLAACEALGVPRLTHHDLRDDFATTCIEAAVDIPTVAAWMGHADGGALLMKVYAHHRGTHSVKAAKNVSFSGGNASAPANTIANALLAAASMEIAKNGPNSPELVKLLAAAKALGISDIASAVTLASAASAPSTTTTKASE